MKTSFVLKWETTKHIIQYMRIGKNKSKSNSTVKREHSLHLNAVVEKIIGILHAMFDSSNSWG